MLTTFKISNIILHIVLISIIIIVIFITYGIFLEKKILENQIEYILDKIFKPIKILAPDTKFFDNDILEKLKIQDTDEIKKKIDIHNKKLLLKGGLFNGVLLLISLIIIIFMGVKYEQKLDNGNKLNFVNYLSKLMQYNLTTLFFVALTYIGFISYIGYNYIYIDEKAIGLNIINKIESKFESKNEI
jgi:hypothetical protein